MIVKTKEIFAKKLIASTVEDKQNKHTHKNYIEIHIRIGLSTKIFFYNFHGVFFHNAFKNLKKIVCFSSVLSIHGQNDKIHGV